MMLRVGDVVTASFPLHEPQGHEQEGLRPAVVIGVPENVGTPRFPLVFVAPLTSDRGQTWASGSPDLYPRFPAGLAGLRSPSIVLTDQVRALDLSRISRRRGQLTATELAPLQAVLRKVLGL